MGSLSPFREKQHLSLAAPQEHVMDHYTQSIGALLSVHFESGSGVAMQISIPAPSSTGRERHLRPLLVASISGIGGTGWHQGGTKSGY